MEKLDFTALLNSFGVPMTVYPKQAAGGHYEGTEWIKDIPDKNKSLPVNEPFIPSSAMRTVYKDGGKLEEYDYIWFSSLAMPMQTIVEHNGTKYSVEDVTPYTDYSNVTMYGCKAVSVFESHI